jgi:hypothetical protein
MQLPAGLNISEMLRVRAGARFGSCATRGQLFKLAEDLCVLSSGL